MILAVRTPVPTPAAPPQPAGRTPLRRHAVVIAGYLAVALGITCLLWWNLPNGYLPISVADNYQFEWFLWHGPHAVLNGANPLFTDLMNWPLGANLMGNASVLGLGLPLAPVTLLFGPQVTFALSLTLAFAGSAAAWYWLFLKLVPGSRWGAVIGGAFCAFAPPMVSHGNGAHLNLVANFVIPFIIWHALQLRLGGNTWWRNGIPLGLLIVYQFFIGEETLLQAVFGLVVFCLAYAAIRPKAAWGYLPGLLKGLPVAAVIAGAMLAYPLWFQFRGPQNYNGIPHGTAKGNDLLALGMSASQSLFGDRANVFDYILNHTEENAFFGWLLLAWIMAMTIWLWRDLRVKLAAIMIVVSFALSLGIKVQLHHEVIAPGPWRLFYKLPLFDSIHPSRMTFVALPFIGLLFALAGKRVIEIARNGDARDRKVAIAVVVAGGLALFPIIPKPFPVDQRPPVPHFFTSGAWEKVINPGDNVLTVPITHVVGDRSTMTWQFAPDGAFSIVGGYFVGPWKDDRRGQYTTKLTSTQVALSNAGRTGVVPQVGLHERLWAEKDLAMLGVDVVLVGPKSDLNQYPDAVVTTLTAMLEREPERIDDVWVWRITS